MVDIEIIFLLLFILNVTCQLHVEQGNEYDHLSFMSTSLQGVKLNYPTIDKQAFMVFRVVK
jgi:hypothetical protein